MTKNKFILLVFLLLMTATLVTFYLAPEIDQGIDSDADAAFFGLMITLTLLLVRLGMFKAALIWVYASSILFCFFYLIISPAEAPLVMTLFFVPAMLWQRRKIGALSLLTTSIALVIFGWLMLGRPLMIILLLPTCQLLAIRLTIQVHSRYVNTNQNIGDFLSLRQRQMRSSDNLDWWDYVKPEIEAMPARLQEMWGEIFQLGSHTHEGSESVLDQHLLQLQSPDKMSKALTDLTKRDKRFSPDLFIKWVEQVFWKVQNACYDQCPEQVQHMVSDALAEQFNSVCREQQAQGIKFKHNRMRVYEKRIVQVNSDDNFDVIHVFIRASSADAIIDLQSQSVIAENQQRRKFCEYWSFIRRPSAKTLGKPGLLDAACPNCSAPLKIGNATVCEACKSYIRSGSFDWVLAKITQACEWEYLEPELLPGWQGLIKSDPWFTTHLAEDRAAVTFWMHRLAERTRSANPMRRYATEALCEHLFDFSFSHDSGNWDLMENINLASVKLKGTKSAAAWDKIFLMMIFSGIPLRFDAKGKIIPESRISKVMRQVYVLSRRKNIKTELKNTLTSAHCHSCGGQLSSTYAVACDYCDTILNEGSSNWILERIINEKDAEYQELIKLTRYPKEDSLEAVKSRSARDVITAMAQIMLADKKIDPAELKLLQEMATKQGMTEADVATIVGSIQDGLVFIPAAKDTREAWALLLAAANMAICDGTLNESEERSLNLLAQQLGYSKADVKRAIKAEVKRRFSEGEEIAPELAAYK